MKQKMLKLLKFLKNHIFSLISLILVIIYVIVGFVSLNDRKNKDYNENNIKVLSIKKNLLNGTIIDNNNNIDVRSCDLDISSTDSTIVIDNSFGYDLFSLNNETQFVYGYVLNYLNSITANKFMSICPNLEPFEYHYKYNDNNYLDLVLTPSITITSNYYTSGNYGYDTSHSYYDETLKCWLPFPNQPACTGDNLTINLKCYIYVNQFEYKFDNEILKSLFASQALNKFDINLSYDNYDFNIDGDAKFGYNFQYANFTFDNVDTIARPGMLSQHTGYELLSYDIPLISEGFTSFYSDYGEDYNKLNGYLRPSKSSDKYITFYNALLNSLKHINVTFKYQYDLFDNNTINYLLNDNETLKFKNSELKAGQQAPQQITDLFIQVLETPYNIIKKGLNFQIFGINFGSVIIGLVSILLGVFVIKKLVQVFNNEFI